MNLDMRNKKGLEHSNTKGEGKKEKRKKRETAFD
jgi:hypothetical protein